MPRPNLPSHSHTWFTDVDGNQSQDLRLTSRSWLHKWLITLLGYDGLLPLVVILVPALIATCLGKGAVVEITAVLLPVVAYLWRLKRGVRHISTNSCHAAFRVVQYATLCLALMFLALVESVMMLSWTLPAQAFKQNDYIILAVLYAIYFALMALAMFPGIEKAKKA